MAYGLGRLQRWLRRIEDRWILRIPPRREADACATHVPVLTAIPRLRPVRRVLELGSGLFSTALFLNRTCFPDLQAIESYENHPHWATTVRDGLGSDPRLRLHLVEEVATAVAGLNLEDFDLILVDDSATGPERTRTIETVARRAPARAVVVIHDFEYPPYRQASASFRHRFRIAGVNPNVGVLGNDGRIDSGSLRRLDRLIRAHRESIPMEDAAGWARLHDREFGSVAARS
jgi:predicted O-methyltransferase YrrM